jgi:hypothetical protein
MQIRSLAAALKYRTPLLGFFSKAYQVGIKKVEIRIFDSALCHSTVVLCDPLCKSVLSVVNFHNERALSSSLLFSSNLILQN